jgi:chromosome segregation ATPase
MAPQSAHLNAGDPVAMHLLMETAMVDSKEFQILPFEEVEELKRERASLQNRIEATRRKLALEKKLRDAAQSLNRLYSPKAKRESDETMADGSQRSPKKTRKSLLGTRSSSEDVLNRTDDEYTASTRKCEVMTQELSAMEKRSEELSKRILEHTAGILQLTHKGLKKNVPRDVLPRSPESMASLNHRSMTHFDGLDDFDDRSLYRSPEPFEDSDGSNRKAELELLQQTEKQLGALNNRLRGMVLQVEPNQEINIPPQKSSAEAAQQDGAQIQAHLDYLGQALESVEAAQSRTVQEAQRSVYDSEDQMEAINLRLHDMLQKTNNLVQSPVAIAPDSRGKSLQAQLSFSSMVLERLDQRVEHLVEQKDILSRQIQQQRGLNSKSDAQRDGQIMDLTNELAQAKRRHSLHEKEAKSATDHIHLLMEQLDSSRQESVLLDQKRQSEDRKLLQNEKDARKRAEDNLAKLTGILKLERENLTKSRGSLQAEKENLTKLRGAMQAEKDGKKRAEDSLAQLKKALQAEKVGRGKAEESLGKLQGTLQAGNDAQRQINENIAQLQGTVLAEKEGRRKADESLAQLQELLQLEKDARRHADDTLMQFQETLQAEKDAARNIEGQLSEVQGNLDEAKIDKAQAEAEVEKCRKEIKDLEGAIVRAQTDLTLVRAELDGAYGTRAQRAADVTMNPAVQKEMDELNDKNTALQNEIGYLKGQDSGNTELKSKVEVLQKELKDTIEDYELMTKASIEYEKDREQLESAVDRFREKCESLEAQLSDEKVKWLGMKSPGAHGLGSPGETTSTMVLKNEFKKMMRDTRAENMKALRVRFFQ